MVTEFNVTIQATSIKIFPGDEAIEELAVLLDTLTYEDEFAEETKTMGYIYDENANILYLHKGVDIDYLRRTLKNVKIINFPCHRYEEMNFEYEEIIAPRNDEQVDVINFIAGIHHHSGNHEESQIFLVKAPGFGKMEPYSNKIPTPTKQGWTYMGDLKVGDYVFGRDGKLTQILEIFEQGVKDIYKVTFADGRIAYCGKEHLWTVKTHKDGAWKTVKLEDMLGDFKSTSPWKERNGRRIPYHYKYYIPMCEAADHPHKDVNIDPYVMGCFIGNGCCTNDVLTYSSGSDEIPNKIAEKCGFTTKRVSEHNYEYTFYHKDGTVVHTAEFFVDYPEFDGCHSTNKRIPNDYLYNDIDSRFELLKGLLDTDGNVSYLGGQYNVRYTSTSLDLLRDIQTLVYSLGYSTGKIVIDSRNDKYTNSFCGSIHLKIPKWIYFILFKASNKHEIALEAEKCKKQGIFNDLLIKNIEYSHREEARCIMVDNEEHLYLTEDYIVTHNTFCSGVAIGKFKLKTLIITHRDNIKKQWMKSLYDMSGFSSKEVYELADSQELYNIAHGKLKLDYDVYVMTHATFRAAVARIQDTRALSKITENLGIGLKIIDEAHLEFRDTLLMDAVMNVKRNVYLTATAGRSNRDENSIFKHVFSNAIWYKESGLLTDNRPKKWVNYVTVEINTHCKPAIYQYRVAGGKGMNPASYGKWVIAYDKKQTHFRVCTELVKTLFKEDAHAKVLIFMPLIDLCEKCQEFIYKKLSYDDTFEYDLDIRTINSHNSKSENERNKKADVIITTIASAGTGTDISGITDIICCSPFVSKITAEQVFGRIRYIPKKCHYYDIFDASVPLDRFWIKSRFKKLKTLALNVQHIQCIDNEEEK